LRKLTARCVSGRDNTVDFGLKGVTYLAGSMVRMGG
jgi:hypothetical protein